MDSLTQLALGAAVGHATLGRQVGRRAIAWGAVLGTLPDLDILIPFGGAVENFTFHRSFSHSLFVVVACAPLCAWLAMLMHRSTREHFRGWLRLAVWVLVTHIVLDACTVYGTQLFWPLPRAPESWGTIFVIDPLYTLPLLVGVVCALITPRKQRANWVGIGLSTAYLLWTVGAKLHVDGVVARQLARDGVSSERVLSAPMPFNSLLWRVLVVDDEGYREGFYSVVADSDRVRFARYESDPSLLDGVRDEWAVGRLDWFTHGLFSVQREGDEVVITDLRMGVEPDYIFRFAVGKVEPAGVRSMPARKLASSPNADRLGWMWRRIWDADAE